MKKFSSLKPFFAALIIVLVIGISANAQDNSNIREVTLKLPISKSASICKIERLTGSLKGVENSTINGKEKVSLIPLINKRIEQAHNNDLISRCTFAWFDWPFGNNLEIGRAHV